MDTCSFYSIGSFPVRSCFYSFLFLQHLFLVLGDNETPPAHGLSRKSPTADQGVQTSGSLPNNAGNRQPRTGGGGRGGDYRRHQQSNYQQQSNSFARVPHDMRGRAPTRGNSFRIFIKSWCVYVEANTVCSADNESIMNRMGVRFAVEVMCWCCCWLAHAKLSIIDVGLTSYHFFFYMVGIFCPNVVLFRSFCKLLVNFLQDVLHKHTCKGH
jgi:hypothetical protein